MAIFIISKWQPSAILDYYNISTVVAAASAAVAPFTVIVIVTSK